jgi:hypothetical protein
LRLDKKALLFLSNEIEDLKIEKQEFVKKITVIEKENKELNNTIITLNEKIIVLEKEIHEFKIKNNNLEFNKLRIKIITAIQDLNNYEKLEVKFTYPLNTCWKKSEAFFQEPFSELRSENTCIANIRVNRNMSNHYIDINDSFKLIENKKKYLLLQLLNLSEENIQNLNDRYQMEILLNMS